MGSARPSGFVADTSEVAVALGRHFAEHNRHAALIALGTALAAAALWVALYGIVHWLTLLLITVISDGEGQVPRGFRVIFVTVGGALLAYAAVDRWLTPDERPRDQKTAAEIAQDFLLAVPRLTLSVPGTLRARQRLSAGELEQAAAFLVRLMAEERLPMSSAGYELPVAEARDRILLALQITGVIDVLHSRQGAVILPGARLPGAIREKLPA